MKLPTTKELAEGIYLTECSPISLKDFARAREALLKADVNYRNSYGLGPEGDFYLLDWKETDKVVLEVPMDITPYIRRPLQAPTEVRGEFLEGESYQVPSEG